jgi:hypothetical protein
MRYIVAAVAILLVVICAIGVFAPERLTAVVAGWPPDTRLYVAVGTRLVLGVIFILGASRCRIPAVIYGVGILALAAALLLVLLGEPRVDALVGPAAGSRRPRLVRPGRARGRADPVRRSAGARLRQGALTGTYTLKARPDQVLRTAQGPKPATR